MNFVQRVKGDQASFGDVVTTVLSMALNEGIQSNIIYVVLDTYKINSIKNSPVCCHLFVMGLEYLNDPDSYADWSFKLLVGPPKTG